jgi:hypothetical protein
MALARKLEAGMVHGMEGDENFPLNTSVVRFPTWKLRSVISPHETFPSLPSSIRAKFFFFDVSLYLMPIKLS